MNRLIFSSIVEGIPENHPKAKCRDTGEKVIFQTAKNQQHRKDQKKTCAFLPSLSSSSYISYRQGIKGNLT